MGLSRRDGEMRRKSFGVTRLGPSTKNSSGKAATFIERIVLNAIEAQSTIPSSTRSGRRIRSGSRRTRIAPRRTRKIGSKSVDDITST